MKRFNFRLQRVLDIKNTIEEAMRRDFLAARAELQKMVDKLKEIVRTLARYQNKLHALEKKGIDLQEINFYYRYFQSLEGQISYQNRMIGIAREEMEKRRSILVEAVKERRILERLKERKFEQYLFEAGKEEQFTIDEISGGKFFQQKNNPVTTALQGVS